MDRRSPQNHRRRQTRASSVRFDPLAINGLRRKIQKGLQKAKTDADFTALVNGLVTMLRLQRQNPKVGHLIGDDCTAVLIKSDFSSSSFFYTRDKKVKRFPNIVRKEFTVEDLQSEPSVVG